MKFNGSVLGRVLGAILCVLLGIVIALGGEVGAVYYIVTKMNVGWVADKIQPSLPEGATLEFSDEVRNMSILDWGKELIATTADMDNSTIGQIESLVGYAAISKALYESIGTDVEVVKASTIGNLGKAISDSLTLGSLSEKFGIGLPDMPLFQDEEFLYGTPVSTAFEGLTDKPLNQFVKVGEDSNAILKKLQNLTIDELGGEKLTETINAMKLNEVIDIQEGVSNNVLVAMQDLTIGELGGEGANEIINSMFMTEIVTIDENSEGVMKTVKYSTLESKTTQLNKAQYDTQDASFRESSAYTTAQAREVDGYEYIYSSNGTAYVFVKEDGEKVMSEDGLSYVVYETKEQGKGDELKNRPIIGINDTIKTATIGELMDIKEGDKPMWSLRESTLNSISADLNRLFLDEIMDITAESSKTIQALRYSALKSAETEISPESVLAEYSEPEKEMKGYVYLYVLNEKGEHIPYVALIEDNGTVKQHEGNYVVLETREYDGYYRPLISLDSKINEIFIGELIDDPTSQTMKSLSDSALTGTKSSITKTALDDSTDAYIAANPDHATYEREGFVYKYSALGLAYICVTDEEGDPIVTDGKYELYNTRFYKEKYYALRGVDDKVDSMVLGEVIDINEDSSPLMKSLRNTRVNKMDDAVNNLFMCEMMTIDNDSAQVMKSIKYAALKESKTAITKATADEITALAPASETAKQLDEYTYFYMKDSKDRFVPYIAVMDGALPKVIDVEGVDHYEVYNVKYLEDEGKYYPIISLDSRLKNLVLSDVFTETQLSTGILSLLDPDTKIDDIGTEVADVVKESSLAILSGVGVLDGTYNMDKTAKEQRAFIWNSNLNTMITEILAFVNDPVEDVEDPITHLPVAPYKRVKFDTISPMELIIDSGKAYYYVDGISDIIVSTFDASWYDGGTNTLTIPDLTTFVALYYQFETIALDDVKVIVNVDTTENAADEAYLTDGIYYIPAFNLSMKSGTGLTLLFQNGTVALASFKDGAVDKQQYYYSFNGTNSPIQYYDGTTIVPGESVTVGTDSFYEFSRTTNETMHTP